MFVVSNFQAKFMLHTRFADRKIVLASQSPRRKELLAGIGLPFETFVLPDIDETIPDGMFGVEAAEYLAQKKASSYKNYITPNMILITADTIVCVENQILNKAKDKTEAADMLRTLSGKTHQVVTGVCISSAYKQYVFSDVADVRFAKLSDAEIDFYIETCKPYDKAGAYGIQEWIGYIGIEHLEGSYFNVMGLPTQKLYKFLHEFV